jgi:hypothetical protein
MSSYDGPQYVKLVVAEEASEGRVHYLPAVSRRRVAVTTLKVLAEFRPCLTQIVEQSRVIRKVLQPKLGGSGRCFLGNGK